MKLLLFVGVLAAGYCYALLHTTDAVVKQVMDLHETYQRVGDHTEKLVGIQNQYQNK